MCRTKVNDSYVCVQYYAGTQGGIAVLPKGCEWRESGLKNHGIGVHLHTRRATEQETQIIKQWRRLKIYWFNLDGLLLDEEENLPSPMFEKLKESLTNERARLFIKERKVKKQRRLPILGQAEMEDGL